MYTSVAIKIDRLPKMPILSQSGIKCSSRYREPGCPSDRYDIKHNLCLAALCSSLTVPQVGIGKSCLYRTAVVFSSCRISLRDRPNDCLAQVTYVVKSQIVAVRFRQHFPYLHELIDFKSIPNLYFSVDFYYFPLPTFFLD